MLDTDRNNVLNAFSSAISREAHVLAAYPHLVWQQLFNRLQWEALSPSQALGTALAHHSEAKERPWLHLRTPFRESGTFARTLTGHTGAVQACAFGRNGAIAVSGGDDSTIRIWDCTNGATQEILTGHRGPVHACAVSSDCSFIVSASEDKTVRIWDASTGAIMQVLEGHQGAVHGCDISPNDGVVASASEDQSLKMWRVSDGTIQHTFATDEPLYDCAFNPDGTLIASVGERGIVHIYRVGDRREARSFSVTHTPLRRCRFSRDGAHLIVAESGNALVYVLNAETGIGEAKFYAHTREHHRFYWGVSGDSGPRGVALAPDGESVISAAADNSLRIWSVRRSEEQDNEVSLAGHASVIRCCDVSPEGRFALAGAEDGTLKLWDLTVESAGDAGIVHSETVSDCAFARDGERFVVVWGDRTAALWRLHEWKQIQMFSGGDVDSCAITRDGQRVATAHVGNLLNVHKVGGGIEFSLSEELGYFLQINACVFDQTASVLVTACPDGTLNVWDLRARGSSDVLRRFQRLEGHTGSVTDCAISSDNNFVVSSAQDGNLIIWDFSQLRLRRILTGHEGPVLSCAVSSNDAFMVSSGADGTVRLWEVEGGNCRAVLAGHTGEVRACAISSDGRFIFSGGNDATLRVWDATTASPVAICALSGGVTSMALHPTRPTIIVGDQGGNLHRVDLVGSPYAATGSVLPEQAELRPPSTPWELGAVAASVLFFFAIAIPLAGLLVTKAPLEQSVVLAVAAGALGIQHIRKRRHIDVMDQVSLRSPDVQCRGELALFSAFLLSVLLAAPTQRLLSGAGKQLLAGISVGLILGLLDALVRTQRNRALQTLLLGAAITASIQAGRWAFHYAPFAAGNRPWDWVAGAVTATVATAIAFPLLVLVGSGIKGILARCLKHTYITSVLAATLAVLGAVAVLPSSLLMIGTTLFVSIQVARQSSRDVRFLSHALTLGMFFGLAYAVLGFLYLLQ
jgi:WD40 repeat protein